MRFRPESGFSRLRSNLSDLVLNKMPPSSIGAASATSTSPAITGSNASTA